MHTRIAIIVTLMGVGLLAHNLAWAQTLDEISGSTDPGPVPASPARTASPSPGEEVMRPTEHGLRMTPALARAMSRMMVRQLVEGSPLPAEQKARMDEALARRIMETCRTHQEMMQQVAEYTVEAMMKRDIHAQQFTAESAAEFGRRVRPMMPVARDFMRSMAEDFDPFLDAHQREAIRRMLDEALSEMDKIDARLERWSNGGYEPGEHPFDNHTPQTQPATESSPAPANASMQQAEESARHALAMLEPNLWEGFVYNTGRYFQFDDSQTARAREILAEYRQRADAIMTPDWKQRIRENRLKQQFRYLLSREQPVAPWFFHLQHEFDQANEPLREMGDAFRKEILALTTPEQRDEALARIRQRAAQHGLTLEDADRTLLGLGAP